VQEDKGIGVKEEGEKEDRRNKEGRPSEWPARGEKAFLRGTRESFSQTTRVNLEKWENGAEIRGLNGIRFHFMAILSGVVGRMTVLGQADRNCFEKQTPKKGLFFSINRRFWGCFLRWVGDAYGCGYRVR
jgi:hypothetical protein